MEEEGMKNRVKEEWATRGLVAGGKSVRKEG